MRSRIALIAALAAAGMSSPALPATIRIAIDKLAFEPQSASAKVGDTVEWTNNDIVAHTATASNGDWNVMLPPKKSGRVTVKKAGAVDYSCNFHPNMKGQIAVAP